MIRIISARHNCPKRNSISQHQTSRMWILWKGEVLWQRPHWEQQGLSWRRSEDWHKLSHNPWSAGSSTWESRRWTCEELLGIRQTQNRLQTWPTHLSMSFWAERRLAPPSSPNGGSHSIITNCSATVKNFWTLDCKNIIELSTPSQLQYSLPPAPLRYTCSTSLNVWCCWSGITWTWTLGRNFSKCIV